jgi:four helix bundle protein
MHQPNEQPNTSQDVPSVLPAVQPEPVQAVEPVLDFKRFDAYNVALEFQLVVARLKPTAGAVLADQLERASVSIVLCVAEGVGRRTRADKARFFTIARGSAMECAAILDVLYLRGLAAAADYDHGQKLLTRSVQMLTRLQQRLG